MPLNGYFTIRDFVVHPDLGTEQRTYIDIFGVRFPYRSELLKNSMQDDELLVEDKIHIVMVEVKGSKCKLNNSWKNKDSQNIEKFLNAIGALPATLIVSAFNELYKTGAYKKDEYSIQFVDVGSECDDKLLKHYPEIDQITHEPILKFIYERVEKYYLQKKFHHQWDVYGKELWEIFKESNSVDEFVLRYIN